MLYYIMLYYIILCYIILSIKSSIKPQCILTNDKCPLQDCKPAAVSTTPGRQVWPASLMLPSLSASSPPAKLARPTHVQSPSGYGGAKQDLNLFKLIQTDHDLPSPSISHFDCLHVCQHILFTEHIPNAILRMKRMAGRQVMGGSMRQLKSSRDQFFLCTRESSRLISPCPSYPSSCRSYEHL